MCRCYNKAVSVHREHIWSNDDYDWSVSSSYAIMYLFTPSVCPAIAVTFKTRVTNMWCSCHDWHIIIIVIIFAGHHQLEDNNLLFAIQNFHASICLSMMRDDAPNTIYVFCCDVAVAAVSMGTCHRGVQLLLLLVLFCKMK